MEVREDKTEKRRNGESDGKSFFFHMGYIGAEGWGDMTADGG